jgi:hypothetical protein
VAPDDLSPDLIRVLVRACGFAITTAEFGLAGRISEGLALEAIAAELDAALQSAGVELRAAARLEASAGTWRRDN